MCVPYLGTKGPQCAASRACRGALHGDQIRPQRAEPWSELLGGHEKLETEQKGGDKPWNQGHTQDFWKCIPYSLSYARYYLYVSSSLWVQTTHFQKSLGVQHMSRQSCRLEGGRTSPVLNCL